MRRIASQFVAMLLAMVVCVPLAVAQTPAPKSPFGIPLPGQSQPSTTPDAPATTPGSTNAGTSATAPTTGARPTHVAAPSFTQRAWAWILHTQSKFNRDMAASVRQIKGDNPFAAALALIALAFGYGVLHAAGPGHGKAVISAYVLANEETVRRGIALSFLSALFQAISAILFVGILALILRQTSLQMRQTEASIETLSWALVAAVGAYLLYRQIKPLVMSRSLATPAPGHGHAHDHTHGPDCDCGHSHMPAPSELQGPWSWRKAMPIALSVGIRPCTGAILLLIFAMSQGMLWAGILGTFAMAFGTALTVSILASMAVGSRNWAARQSGPGSQWAGYIQTAAGLAGAAAVFVLGSLFFVASLSGPGPL